MFNKIILFSLSMLFTAYHVDASQGLSNFQTQQRQYKSVAVQLNLDDESSQRVFDLQSNVRGMVDQSSVIPNHYGNNYCLSYTGSASYPHITIEIFKHNLNPVLEAGETGRMAALIKKGSLNNTFSNLSRTQQSHDLSPSITDKGLRVWATNLKLIVKLQDKKNRDHYWEQNTADSFDIQGYMRPATETQYYDENNIANLYQMTNKDIVSATFVLECSKGFGAGQENVFDSLRNGVISGINSDKNMKYFTISNPNFGTNLMHITLLKLKAVRTSELQQYLTNGGNKKGNVDILWDIPNPNKFGQYPCIMMLEDLFKKANDCVFANGLPSFDCDMLVANAMLNKTTNGTGSSPLQAPSRKPGEWDKKGITLTHF